MVGLSFSTYISFRTSVPETYASVPFSPSKNNISLPASQANTFSSPSVCVSGNASYNEQSSAKSSTSTEFPFSLPLSNNPSFTYVTFPASSTMVKSNFV